MSARRLKMNMQTRLLLVIPAWAVFCIGYLYASPGVDLLLLLNNEEQKTYELNASALVPMHYSDIIAADFDGDGDMDIVQSGDLSTGTEMHYYNNKKGTFVRISNPLDTDNNGVGDSALPGVGYEAVLDAADMDKDGDMDLIGTGSGNTYLLENLGSGVFRNRSTWVDTDANGTGDAVFAGTWQGFVSFADDNQDGYYDVLLNAADGTPSLTTLYRNEKNHTFSLVANPVQGTSELLDKNNGTHAWGDFNKDNYLDLIIIGGQNDASTVLYQNLQNGTFTRVANPVDGSSEFLGLFSGPVFWGDFDKDNDPDIIVSATEDASASFTPHTILYRNNGNGTFTLVPAPIDTNADGIGDAAFSIHAMSECIFVDFDKDNDLDIYMLGWDPDADGVNQLFKNNGAGVYTAITNPVDTDGNGTGDSPLPPIGYGGAAFADFDRDGYLDLVFNGHLDDFVTKVSKMYRNNGKGLFRPVN